MSLNPIGDNSTNVRFKQWLGAFKPDLCHDMASVGHNELNCTQNHIKTWIRIWYVSCNASIISAWIILRNVALKILDFMPGRLTLYTISFVFYGKEYRWYDFLWRLEAPILSNEMARGQNSTHCRQCRDVGSKLCAGLTVIVGIDDCRVHI